MLNELQRRVSGINGIDPGHDIREFLVTDPQLAAALSGEQLLPNSSETVLVAEDDEGIALSVFLDRAVLARLQSADPINTLRGDCLEDLWAVLEGISHFNYLASSAQRERPVTLLELELQAEVDKYATTVAMLDGQGQRSLSAHIHRRLFETITFRKELDAEQRARYETANDYASRFCHLLRDGLLTGSDRANAELRNFSRCSQQGKISRIHALTWGRA